MRAYLQIKARYWDRRLPRGEVSLYLYFKIANYRELGNETQIKLSHFEIKQDNRRFSIRHAKENVPRLPEGQLSLSVMPTQGTGYD